jgi:hypothetical protein
LTPPTPRARSPGARWARGTASRIHSHQSKPPGQAAPVTGLCEHSGLPPACAGACTPAT